MGSVEERWVVCCGGNYAISDHGRFKRATDGNRTETGRILKLTRLAIGYDVVQPVIGGKNKMHYVHRLVAEHFIGPPPDSMEVNHKDGDKTNNHFSNLEYVTHEGNMRHAFRTGLIGDTAIHGIDVALRIRSDRLKGVSYNDIARKNNVSLGFAYRCCDGTVGRSKGMQSIVGRKQKTKLTTDSVVEMRKRRSLGESCVSLASCFEVSETQVSAICCGLKWKNAGGPITRTKR